MSERVTALVRIIIYKKHKRAFLARPYGCGIRENEMLSADNFFQLWAQSDPAGAHTQSAETSFRCARTCSCSRKPGSFLRRVSRKNSRYLMSVESKWENNDVLLQKWTRQRSKYFYPATSDIPSVYTSILSEAPRAAYLYAFLLRSPSTHFQDMQFSKNTACIIIAEVWKWN